jgi:hypothetical protein
VYVFLFRKTILLFFAFYFAKLFLRRLWLVSKLLILFENTVNRISNLKSYNNLFTFIIEGKQHFQKWHKIKTKTRKILALINPHILPSSEFLFSYLRSRKLLLKIPRSDKHYFQLNNASLLNNYTPSNRQIFITLNQLNI